MYYMQEFKVAFTDEQYPKVLDVLRSDEYKIRNIFLKDIDVTMNYAGNFAKDEIVNFLTSHKGFRIQGSYLSTDRTILDNSDQVGENFLTCGRCYHPLQNLQQGGSKVREQECSRDGGPALEGLGLSKGHAPVV